jgi:adenosine deaminase
MKLDNRQLAGLPKVLLHEHLDGVLRPQTVIDLARETKYAELPTSDPDALAQWFHQGS